MHKAFQVHMLNDQGKVKANKLAETFNTALEAATEIIGSDTREASLCVTHMELASFYAKKAMAQKPENQQ